MPSRNRSREAAKAAAERPAAKRKKSGRKKAKARTGPMFDPSAVDDAEIRHVQPYEATKAYLCPGCSRDIPPGVGHLVAVPPDEPDLRRHWHRGCWHNRHTRF